MTCKDCVHYEVCRYWGNEGETEEGLPDCPDFKSKSRFVELPCEMLDKLYFYTHDKLFELCVQQIDVHKDIDYFRDAIIKIGGVFNNGTNLITVYYNARDIGRVIFKTPEEAKRAAIGDL